MIVAALAVSLAFQGSRGLYESSEGRYAECAREMIETGDWLEPTLDYAPHWTKPPMAYWTIALGMNWLGQNEWGVRIMNAVAFFLTILAVSWIGATLWDRRTGAVAGLIYGTSLFPAAGSFCLTTDTVLTLWEVSTVLCFIRAVHSNSPGNRSVWILAMSAGFGLGFLTKGPPSLIPLIPMGVWYLKTRTPEGFFSLPGLLLFALIGLSWYLLVCGLHPGLLAYFIGTEIVARIATGHMRNPEWYGPLKVYLPVILLGGGIWCIHGFRLLVKKRLQVPGRFRRILADERWALFLVSWLVLPLVLFVFVRSRLPLYILPLYTPFTLLVARGLTVETGTNGKMGRILWAGVLSAVLIVGLKGVSAYYPSQNNMKALYEFCMEKVPDLTEVVVFDGSKMFGLDYYLHGNLIRISASGEEHWADASVEETLRGFGTMPVGTRPVIVSKKKKSALLDQFLQGTQIVFRQYENRKWILYVPQAGMPDPDQSGSPTV